MNFRSFLRSRAVLPTAALYGSALCVMLSGCGDDPPPATNLPYAIDTTVVIHSDGTTEVFATPDGAGCIQLASECVPTQTLCGSDSARVDLVVDSAGNLVEHVCYPITDDGVIIASDANVLANSPGEVVVIADDAQITGNIDLNGANTVVYGELDKNGDGIADDSAVIDGDIRLSGNQTIARGVRIKGDLELFGADTAALFVIVEGNVMVTGSGALLANSVVFGNVNYSGQTFDFIGNAVGGTVMTSAAYTQCRDNVLFDDLNTNLLLERDAEVTGPYVCP